MRAPVGGLFRHVVDLARGQIARGHRVGLVADASTGGAQAEATLAELAPALALGLSRVAMSRQLGLRDVTACAHVARALPKPPPTSSTATAPRAAPMRGLLRQRAIRVYTPHGGSLHYDWSSPAGFVYLASERLLMRRTDLFLFESAYGRDVFSAKIGEPGARARVAHNGVTAAEFGPLAADPQATDLVFVGELRVLKGVDVLIEALAMLARDGRRITATIVGDGPDRAAFEAEAATPGPGHPLRGRKTRARRVCARAAAGGSLARGIAALYRARGRRRRPSRHCDEGRRNSRNLWTRCRRLVPPGDPAALAQAIGDCARDATARRNLAQRLQAEVRTKFSADAHDDGGARRLWQIR